MNDRKMFYICLQNLPNFSTHKDVLSLLEGVPMLQGGVSIHDRDAFVAFPSCQILDRALDKNGSKINGFTVTLCALEYKDLHKMKYLNARRKLQFKPANLSTVKKRIRPTSQLDDQNSKTFQIFNPLENEIEEKPLTVPANPKKRRKIIKPTKLDQLPPSSAFFQNTDYQMTGPCAKRLKLDLSLFSASMISV